MSISSEATSKDTAASEADVAFNRLNVALARSQKIIRSWLPQKAEPTQDQSNDQKLEDDEGFKSIMTGAGGIGSAAAYEDDDLPDGAFQRKKLSSNDRLLEQLLGKKAAQAKRKSREVGESVSTSKHAAPKSVVASKDRDADSEEDEGGRASAFKSRKAFHKPQKKEEAARIDTLNDMTSDNAVSDGEAGSRHRGSASRQRIEVDQRSSKRKQGSYLDELLAQKSKKNKKRKKAGVSV